MQHCILLLWELQYTQTLRESVIKRIGPLPSFISSSIKGSHVICKYYLTSEPTETEGLQIATP